MENTPHHAEPECFGDLDTVFPMSKDGLRHTPQNCMACPHKTQCLRNALRGGGGSTVKEEMVDRAYASGTMGFWKRWSLKKKLHQKKR